MDLPSISQVIQIFPLRKVKIWFSVCINFLFSKIEAYAYFSEYISYFATDQKTEYFF